MDELCARARWGSTRAIRSKSLVGDRPQRQPATCGGLRTLEPLGCTPSLDD